VWNLPDYDALYRVLGLQPGASLEEIDGRWKLLANLWHPDKIGRHSKETSTRRLQEINNARDELRGYWRAYGRPPPTTGEFDKKPLSRSTSAKDFIRSRNGLGWILIALGFCTAGVGGFIFVLLHEPQNLTDLTTQFVEQRKNRVLTHLQQEADALFREGQERGDAALAEAVDRYRLLVALEPRKRAPLDWAASQNNLGTALVALGERQNRAARLEEAVAAYRAALEEWTQERVPVRWAGAQNNLGIALAGLAEGETGTKQLEEAITAYRAALQERTRERTPLDWAATQNNLANALLKLGQRESGTARLKEAIAAFQATLNERTREHLPLDWATTQNNLGVALRTLAERESSTDRLEEAVAAFRAALEEAGPEPTELQRAMIQTNLGTALRALGEQETGTARLEEAVAAYESALRVFVSAGSHHYAEICRTGRDLSLAVLNHRRH
jgi:tetratricopeptide (TPR) repeat protein